MHVVTFDLHCGGSWHQQLDNVGASCHQYHWKKVYETYTYPIESRTITSGDPIREIMQYWRLTGVRYRDEVLRPIVVPFQRRVGRNFEFQQDNARPHTARVSMEFLQHHNVTVLPWPAKSPDLSPIEHLWDVIGRRVRGRDVQPQTLDALFIALQDEWRAVPRAVIRNLIQSVPRRCQSVIRRHGGHTRYWLLLSTMSCICKIAL